MATTGRKATNDPDYEAENGPMHDPYHPRTAKHMASCRDCRDADREIEVYLASLPRVVCDCAHCTTK